MDEMWLENKHCIAYLTKCSWKDLWSASLPSRPGALTRTKRNGLVYAVPEDTPGISKKYESNSASRSR